MKRSFSRKLFVVLIVFFFVAEFAPQLESASPVDSADNGWIAQPMYVALQAQPYAYPQGYSPNQIKTAYCLPSSGGAGATIAIIDAYDTPSIWNDLGNFSEQFGLPLPTSSNFEVHKMAPNIATNEDWTQETCLDVEWAHAIAPEAKILLIEAADSNSNNLLPALAYAKEQADVVAVSMSWGTDEHVSETSQDEYFTNNNGIIFYAASGDSGAGTMWPACSPYVVAVGGTTLVLDGGGNVISETAWSGSGGGYSRYDSMPSYQTSFGLTGNRRQVPDVSYNANPATGFPVYCNGQWHEIGGTSAGAPQWAAIQALGHSASNSNLYRKAKTAYATYFRDITSGSNGDYLATAGYDLVTGLGSPLTHNFGTDLSVTPNAGPAGASIAITGTSFTASSSVGISWQNPLTSAWTLINSNVATDATGNFTVAFTVPDLLQNNLAGDNAAGSNDIVFRAVDNGNGRSYTTAVPYAEMRRGISQVASRTATGLYGNNTDLSTSAFVQKGQSITVTGKWFPSGTATLVWDNSTALGTATADATGLFSVSLQVPADAAAGKHTLTVIDRAAVNFTLTLTRLPTVTDNYTAGWHTSDFAIALTSDSPVADIYYKINDGATQRISVNGQPQITSEGAANKLEYWGVWDVYGTGSMDLPSPHAMITGIQLDKTQPTASLQINGGASTTASTAVTLTLNAQDSSSGVGQMRFSNDQNTLNSAAWQPYADSASWNLTGDDGAKTVYCQLRDSAGLTSATFSASIILDTTPPPTPTHTPTPPAPTSTDTSSGTDSSIPTPTADGGEPSVTPEAPESSIQMILVLLALITFSFVVKAKSKKQAP